MGIVLPEGVFGNKQEGYVWAWLYQKGKIKTLLDCPRTTFQPSTDTKTNVLFFQKASGVAVKNNGHAKVEIGVALRCGHDRRGRTHKPDGTRHEDDFEKLASSFHAGATTPGSWREVSITNATYLVPRYYVRDHAFSEAESEIIKGATMASIGNLIDDGIVTIR